MASAPEDRLPAANRASQGPVTFAVAVGSREGRPSGLQFCFFSVRAWVRTEKKQFFVLRKGARKMDTDTEQMRAEIEAHDVGGLAGITAAVALLAALSWAYLLL